MALKFPREKYIGRDGWKPTRRYTRITSVRDDLENDCIKIVTVMQGSHPKPQAEGPRRRAMVRWVRARLAEEGWYDLSGYVCERMDTRGSECVLFFHCDCERDSVVSEMFGKVEEKV